MNRIFVKIIYFRKIRKPEKSGKGRGRGKWRRKRNRVRRKEEEKKWGNT